MTHDKINEELASMGPPIFIGGNGTPVNGITAGCMASMGPPIFIGGNPRHTAVFETEQEGFNGAADFHRRKWSRPRLPLTTRA